MGNKVQKEAYQGEFGEGQSFSLLVHESLKKICFVLAPCFSVAVVHKVQQAWGEGVMGWVIRIIFDLVF